VARGDSVVETRHTLARTTRAEIREKGSRFIATAAPARDEAEARAVIDSVRSEFPDATHHVWGFAVAAGAAAPVERSHDAGEPKGTGGPPLLQAIRGAGLADVVVVVSRYFGGRKLGKGGLARAYRAAASRALEGAPRREAIALLRLLVRVPLALDGEARHLVARHGGRVESASYEHQERPALRVTVPAAARDALAMALRDLARGAGTIEDEAPSVPGRTPRGRAPGRV